MNDAPRIINASDWVQQIVVSDLPYVAWKRRWFLVLGGLCGALMGLFIVMKTKQVYQADALIQVEIRSSASRSTTFMEMSDALGLSNPAEGEATVMLSRTVIGEAARTLNLDTRITPRRAIWDRLLHTPLPAIAVAELRIPDALEGTKFKLEVTDSVGGYCIKSDSDLVLAKGQAGVLLDSASNPLGIHLRITGFQNSAPGQVFEMERLYLDDVASEIASQLTADERGKKTALIGLVMKGGNPKAGDIVNAVAKAYINQDILRRQREAAKSAEYLQQQIPFLKASLDSSEMRLSQYKSSAGSVDITQETSLAFSLLQSMHQQLLALEDRKKETLQSFRPDHPSVKTIDSSIILTQRMMDQQEKKLRSLPGQAKELVQLARDLEVNSERYLEVLREAQQFRVIQFQKISNARLLDPAVTIPLPKRNPVVVFLLAIATGVVLAGLGSVGMHYLKGGISSPDLIEAATWAPVLAILPRTPEQRKLEKQADGGAKGLHILAVRSPYEYAVESVRSLKGPIFNCLQQSSGNRAILITSPTPDCGKTFVSANLAVSLAQAGLRVALVDMDFRQGDLHKVFGRPRLKGLIDHFSGSLPLDGIETAVDLPGLSLVTCGLATPKPGFAPGRKDLDAVIASLSQRHDVVLLDAPPLLSIADTSILAQASAGTLLVLQHDQHSLGEVVECRKKLQQIEANLLGVVLNGVDPMASINGRRFSSQMIKYAPSA